MTSSSAAESDSESDIYGSSRRKTINKKHRQQQLQASSDSGPAHGELRFSTRKAAKVSNYNEDDSDDFEEDMQTEVYWQTTADANVPAIDAVLNHRLRDDISKLSTPRRYHLADLS